LLPNKTDRPEEERKFNSTQLRKFACDNKMKLLWGCSAKLGLNIDEAFTTVAREAVRHSILSMFFASLSLSFSG
jgi:hypothetical protein